MRVFVTGASGWIGSAVTPDLLRAGHEVVGLARSDASAAALSAMGAEVRRGELTDADALRGGAADADGVIHLAFVHDFSQFERAIEIEGEAIAALGAALEGTGKPLVIASGTPASPGRVATERDEPAPGSPLTGRFTNAQNAVAMAAHGVRSSVVRLPRSVHGDGDAHGFIAQMVRAARESGVSGYVGDGSNRWPAVHVQDAADLFRLALERAEPGTVWHAVGDEGVALREIADAIGRHLELPVEPVAPDAFGFLGMVMSIDQPASSALTREGLGWQPSHPELLEDVEAGHYFS